MNRFLFALMWAPLLFAPATGQDTLSSSYTGASSGLTITTNVEHALVFMNDTAMGTTPLTLDGLEPGAHRLRVVHPQGESWFVNTIHDSVSLAPGEKKTLAYTFDTRVAIMTLPSGATVLSGADSLGTTPLVLQPAGGKTPLLLQKAGYEQVQLEKLQSPGMTIHLKRSPLAGDANDVMPGEIYIASGPSARLYITGIAAVLAGSTAAYFKVKADNVYADYRFTRDPALLARTNRLDTAAGIALVATQVSLGLFTYFLLAE